MPRKTGIFGLAAFTRAQAAAKGSIQTVEKRQPQLLRSYNVVLLNDDDHTYEYVIQLMRTVFAYPEEKGFQLAKTVDEDNRVVVYTTHKELAELKREQIQAFGTDHRIATCKGSMSAIIEPA